MRGKKISASGNLNIIRDSSMIIEQYRELLKSDVYVVTDYIESKYSVHLTGTADKPSALDEALEHAIDGGRIIVERRIIRFLTEKLGLNEEFTSVESFEKRVQETKQKFINQERQL